MFTEKFDRYVCQGDTISCEVDGFTVTARIEYDQDSGPPWENEDGHGPVSEWTRRDKAPGERLLCDDSHGGSKRYYDFAEAVRLARRDGWGSAGDDGLKLGEKAARAAERDFDVLRAWCRDEWRYCGVVLSVSRDDVTLDEYAASLWSIEANYPDSDNSYLADVANELLAEAVDVGKAAMVRLVGTWQGVES
jgi:hypothetical protein